MVDGSVKADTDVVTVYQKLLYFSKWCTVCQQCRAVGLMCGCRSFIYYSAVSLHVNLSDTLMLLNAISYFRLCDSCGSQSFTLSTPT